MNPKKTKPQDKNWYGAEKAKHGIGSEIDAFEAFRSNRSSKYHIQAESRQRGIID